MVCRLSGINSPDVDNDNILNDDVDDVNIPMPATMPKIRSAGSPPYHHGDLRRALIDAALALVTNEQNWAFSLRELARRAGVSHNAPYNHFSEKKELLGAVAAVGFERLRDGMLAAIAAIDTPEVALITCARTYVRLGLENPALYRLMFGPALSDTEYEDRPTIARSAGAEARGVLEQIIWRGARAGVFSVSPDNSEDLALAALSVWSAAHGLTMLIIDHLTRPDVSMEDMIERVLRTATQGLR
jgi:AcrR family transcriptional regulator